MDSKTEISKVAFDTFKWLLLTGVSLVAVIILIIKFLLPLIDSQITIETSQNSSPPALIIEKPEKPKPGTE